MTHISSNILPVQGEKRKAWDSGSVYIYSQQITIIVFHKAVGW